MPTGGRAWWKLAYEAGESPRFSQVHDAFLAVGVKDHEDVIYSVLRVVRPGPASEFDPGSFYMSGIDTVVDVSSIEQD